MAYESYAEFLDALEKAGELIRVTEPIATELEITELADREMKKPGGGKALLIEQPTVNGEVSPMPVTREASPAPLWNGISPAAWIEDIYTRHGQVQKPTPHLLIAGYIFKHV